MLTKKTKASTSATHSNADRLPTIVAINEMTIATPQGQRSARQSSQGASPPQYSDRSAVLNTAVLATSTRAVNPWLVGVIPS